MTRKIAASDAVTAEVELVKPATAEEWLGKNTSNRPVRERVVAAYARDMLAGKWRLSGEGVKFAADGTLLDGQHRLHAVVRADVAVWLLVVRGLAHESQLVMDSGVARTAGDALRLLGEGSYSSLAAAARLAIDADAGRLRSGGTNKVTHTEVIDFIRDNPDMRTAVDLACSWRKQIDVPLSVLSLAIWRLLRVDGDACVLFFSRVADKTNLTSRDPILALINRLAEIRRSNRRADRADYLSLIFRAWNLWRTRKPVTNLPIQYQGGPVDIPDPR